MLDLCEKWNSKGLFLRRVILLFGGMVGVLGIAVLLAWWQDWEALKRIRPAWVSMKPNTALGLLLGGTALLLFPFAREHFCNRWRMGLLCLLSIVMGLLGGGTLLQYFFQMDLRVDQLLFVEDDPGLARTVAGRMAPLTAFSFLLFSLAGFISAVKLAASLRIPLVRAVGGTLAFMGAMVFLVSSVEYFSDLPWWTYTGMAVHTAGAFFFLGCGLLIAAELESPFSWHLQNAVTLGFVGGMVIMMTAAHIAHDRINFLLETVDQFARTQEFLQQLETLERLNQASENLQRSYFLTPSPGIRAEHLELDGAISRTLDVVSQYAGHYELEEGWVTALGTLFQERLLWEKRTMSVRSNEGLDEAMELLQTGLGIEILERLRAHLTAARSILQRKLEQEEKETAMAGTYTLLTLPLGMFLTLGLFLSCLFFLNSGLREAARSEKKLQSLNLDLERRVEARTKDLQAVNAELESFCYSVSHDLRAPLRGIAGFSQILMESCEKNLDETSRDYFGRVLAATERMGELIDDLLKLSRVAREELSCQAVDLTQLAWQILAHFQKEDPHRAVAIHVQEGMRVPGDPDLLRVALENLLGNAWKFTGKTSAAEIRFGCETRDGETVFSVTDNGAGFDMRYAGKLFSPFQRLHSMAEFPGTGIGLATVQRIIHRHGGRVHAEGVVGKGATFSFTIPEP